MSYLVDLDPAQQVFLADSIEQGRVVGSYMTAKDADDLVVLVTAGHEPALASDQLHSHRLPSGLDRPHIAKILA